MITFTCSNKECSNKDIENNFRGFDKLAVCGGCQALLVGFNEQPDPEIIYQTEE
jgi:hypothetical protein